MVYRLRGNDRFIFYWNVNGMASNQKIYSVIGYALYVGNGLPALAEFHPQARETVSDRFVHEVFAHNPLSKDRG